MVIGLLVVGAGGLAAGLYVVPSESATTTTTSSTTTTVPSTTTSPGQMIPIAVQPTNDQVSPPASVLMPSSCVLRGSTVTATGTTGFVPEIYRREGDVVELYVYTAPQFGFSNGIQLGYLGNEKPPLVGYGSGIWTVSVQMDTSLGTPAQCAVTVQATHQGEGAPNAY